MGCLGMEKVCKKRKILTATPCNNKFAAAASNCGELQKQFSPSVHPFGRLRLLQMGGAGAGTGGKKGKTKDPRQSPRAFCFEFTQQF